MPRNSEGVYSKPTGTAATPNATITSAQFNNTVDDLVTDANTARPLVAGGTGAVTAAAARTNLDVTQKVASTSDFTAGRGLIVGSGGLLADAVTVVETNLNDVVTGGTWDIPSPTGISNMPMSSAGVLSVTRRTDARYVQTFQSVTNGSGGRAFSRTYTGAAWTGWLEHALVEKGSNALGSWRKYSDGLVRMVSVFITIDLNSPDIQTQGLPIQLWSSPTALANATWLACGFMPTSLNPGSGGARVAAIGQTVIRIEDGIQWDIRVPESANVAETAGGRLWAEGEWF